MPAVHAAVHETTFEGYSTGCVVYASATKSSKNYKPLKKMSQTKPHPSVPPPLAKSDGEYFPRVFHVVIPDPPNSSAILTCRSGWQKSGERAG
jgi:hypothetical protein